MRICLPVLLFLLAWRVLAGTEGDTEPAISLVVMMDDRTLPQGSEIRLPPDPRNIHIYLEHRENGSLGDLGRVRFKLDGYDPDWRELGVDMSLGVRFLSEKGTTISQKIFSAAGISVGWNHDLERSHWIHREETLQVPDGTRLLSIYISSAGPPTAMGIYAVANMTLRRRSPDGQVTETRLEPILRGGEDWKPDADLTNWVRDGTLKSLAKLAPLPDGNHALLLVDDSTTSHGEWRLAGRGLDYGGGETGGQLTLSWDEAYSIGYGQRSRADYTRIPAGKYRFWVQKLDVFGNPLPEQTSIAVEVEQPWWQRPWLWVALGGMAGLLSLLGIRRHMQAKHEKELDRLRQQHLLESDRLRIARNIHDDLGARLTHVILASNMAAEGAGSLEEARKELREISGMTRELVSALKETVWTVDPQNDSLQSLLDFLCEMTQKLCDAANIRSELDVVNDLPSQHLSSEFRHHVILAVKEAINNAVKHSGTVLVILSARVKDGRLKIVVRDKGRGFVGQPGEGHGLENMQYRAEAVGGNFKVLPGKEGGTDIQIDVPLPIVRS